MSQPLCSISITETSSLLRVGPPPCLASVLSSLWVLHLDFSLNIKTTGSHVPHKSLEQNHAAFMPSTTQAVSRFPLDLSRSTARSSVLMLTLQFRHLISGSLTLVFLIHTCRDLCLDFSSTLTTMALYQCSLRWFEACSCKPAPKGLPSSFVQLRTLYIKVRSWRTSRIGSVKNLSHF
jgi:hypothetical protein